MARKHLPIQKVTNGVVNGATIGITSAAFDPIANKNISAILLALSVTVLATGAATKSVPTVALGLTEYRMVAGSGNARRRLAAQMFGANGLNALNDSKNAGMVQYFQAGAAITAVVNGVTYGATPVMIGSAADVAIQAALANNTTTTAKFYLPILFTEDYRKDVAYAEQMSYPMAFANAAGQITGPTGAVTIQCDLPAITNVAGGVSNITLTATEECDDGLLPQGSTLMLSKEKIYQEGYTAADVELAGDFDFKAGDLLQRISLLTVADQITKVVVKQGETILKQVTFEENMIALSKSGFNVAAIPRNRFDIEFDINDNPNTAQPYDPNHKFSVIATFATAADAAKQVQILTSTYGKLE